MINRRKWWRWWWASYSEWWWYWENNGLTVALASHVILILMTWPTCLSESFYKHETFRHPRFHLMYCLPCPKHYGGSTWWISRTLRILDVWLSWRVISTNKCCITDVSSGVDDDHHHDDDYAACSACCSLNFAHSHGVLTHTAGNLLVISYMIVCLQSERSLCYIEWMSYMPVRLVYYLLILINIDMSGFLFRIHVFICNATKWKNLRDGDVCHVVSNNIT